MNKIQQTIKESEETFDQIIKPGRPEYSIEFYKKFLQQSQTKLIESIIKEVAKTYRLKYVRMLMMCMIRKFG